MPRKVGGPDARIIAELAHEDDFLHYMEELIASAEAHEQLDFDDLRERFDELDRYEIVRMHELGWRINERALERARANPAPEPTYEERYAELRDRILRDRRMTPAELAERAVESEAELVAMAKKFTDSVYGPPNKAKRKAGKKARTRREAFEAMADEVIASRPAPAAVPRAPKKSADDFGSESGKPTPEKSHPSQRFGQAPEAPRRRRPSGPRIWSTSTDLDFRYDEDD